MNSTVQDRTRSTLGSQPPGPTYSGHQPWGSSSMGASSTATFGTSAATLNDSLTQSRLQYQPGYLMSLAQGQSVSPSAQRYEEAPIIPTKAKMNPAFARTASSDFGTESMFASSKHRQRETFDENGPPSGSVMDIVDELQSDSFSRVQVSKPDFSNSKRTGTMNNRETANYVHTPSKHTPLHIIVFGYPPARFSSTVAYFKSIAEGGTTDIEPNQDVENAFKIGYHEVWEAARACRRNGDIISGDGGRWMIGVKWADPQLAEQFLGPAVSQPAFSSTQTLESTTTRMDASPDPSFGQLQRLSSRHESNSSIGTPIKLTPASSAYKKANSQAFSLQGKTSALPGLAAGGENMGTPSPSKGVVGQFTDLIFGW